MSSSSFLCVPWTEVPPTLVALLEALADFSKAPPSIPVVPCCAEDIMGGLKWQLGSQCERNGGKGEVLKDFFTSCQLPVVYHEALGTRHLSKDALC